LFNGPQGSLGEALGDGGEGTVYRLNGHPPLAIKIFLPSQDLESKISKLKAQLKIKEQIRSKYVNWPKQLVCNLDNAPVGYLMKRVENAFPMSRLAHAMLWRDYFPATNRGEIASALSTLCRIIEDLHRCTIVVGDLNLENILISRDLTEVHLIDTDSMQFSSEGKTFRSAVGRADFTPPEFQGVKFDEVDRNIESDLFSLGIVIFQALMLGQHPYSVIGGSSVVQNIKSGYFPYGPKGVRPGFQGAVPRGNWYNLWSHLTGKMKGLFIRCFDRDKGAFNPTQRPSLSEWRSGLDGFAHEVRIGRSIGDMKPLAAKNRSANSHLLLHQFS
jgi:DNA-binding helix-hairpin-helix protein with protein kinase domain